MISETQLRIYFWKENCRNSNVYEVKRTVTYMKIKFAFRKQSNDFTSTEYTNEKQRFYLLTLQNKQE